MEEYTKREWIIEHDWKCRHCKHTNPGRRDDCEQCGKVIDDKHEEIVPQDTSFENRVKDKKVKKILTGDSDWICFYCNHRERAEKKECSNCGSEKSAGEVLQKNKTVKPVTKEAPVVKKEEAKKTSVEPESNYRTPSHPVYIVDEPNRPQINIFGKIKKVLFFVGAGTALVFLFWLLFFYGSWIDTTARVTGVSWTSQVEVKTREIRQGHSWKHNEPLYVFNETCHQEVSGYHACNPYSCNPHSQSYSCNCREVCRPVESCRTVCRSTGRRSSSCREVCSTRQSCRTSCSTCSRTVTDTCYRRCPDYEDMCDYSYPYWQTTQTQTTTGTNFTITRPTLGSILPVCPTNPETLFLSTRQITCKTMNESYHVQFNVEKYGSLNEQIQTLQEFQRFTLGSQWPAQYNRMGFAHILIHPN